MSLFQAAFHTPQTRDRASRPWRRIRRSRSSPTRSPARGGRPPRGPRRRYPRRAAKPGSSSCRSCHRRQGGLRSDLHRRQGRQALEGASTRSSTDRVEMP